MTKEALNKKYGNIIGWYELSSDIDKFVQFVQEEEKKKCLLIIQEAFSATIQSIKKQ